jgi:putative SOS response-associated peptidase YedK
MIYTSDMCGRIAQFDKEKLAERYNVKPGPSFDATPHWNVAPGQYAPVITREGVEMMKWGLVPWYVKDTEVAKARRLVNAMAETVAQKPTFKQALHRRRCIVPASGFYEWLGRQPYYFHPTKDDVFSLAGLYEVRRDAEGRDYKTFCIITTKPNATVEPVHDRMPAILFREAEQLWLDPYIADPAQILPLLTSYPATVMAAYAVPALVSNVRNDGPELIHESREVA